MMRLLSRFVRRQEGVALPVAIGALGLTTTLAAGTFAVVLEGNHSSVRDRDSKRALGAAEAGLQMAALHVSELKPLPQQCVTIGATGGAVIAAPTAGECPATVPQPIGNGASYTYVVSTASATLPCPKLDTAPPAATDRCITAIGRTNGVTRRLQLRFNFVPPHQPWGEAGLVARDRVDIDNGKIVNSPVGTNGVIDLGNNTKITGNLIMPDGYPDGPAGSVVHKNGATVNGGDPDAGVVDKNPPWQFPTLDWTVLPRTTNNNALLNPAANTGFTGCPIPSCWNPTTMVLTPPDNGTIWLPADTDGITDFRMCKIDASNTNEFWLNVPQGKVTRIWIDSPRMPGGTTACNGVPDAGTFEVKNKGHFNATDDTNPAELEFYLWGTSGDSLTNPDVNWKNNVEFFGTIWAPDSTIYVFNNNDVAGAFTAKNIDLKNNGEFSRDPRVTNKSLPGTATAESLSWFECRRNPAVATDPESGCSS